jgi:hypothetical protein
MRSNGYGGRAHVVTLSHSMGEQSGLERGLVGYASYAAITSRATAPPLMFTGRDCCRNVAAEAPGVRLFGCHSLPPLLMSSYSPFAQLTSAKWYMAARFS